MATSPPGFLRRVYDIPTDSSETIYTGDERKQGCLLSPDQGRPYVTLTFAQSLDAKIAGMGGKQLALSGKESMLMTHCDEIRASRRSSLEAAGARIVEVSTGADGRIPIPALLVKLRGLGMRSLMVEGGARVIQCFLAAEAQHRNCIDTVIVTIAPTIVGKDGVAYGSNLPSDTLPAMQHVETELFVRIEMQTKL
ncbi:hypothetical protein EVJ58_g930 [Rhodofomes roseus]|uniref:2,5-diamino-6-ribosylamino-4(3H)-pyrimidinone 5'-phosphate reductase n=1 Tax=Rhodofomes roseus TaxID=34475 RepID=A0A4Y9Z450_9APHY|nr:hypothetical protein EVJ58_g930 [Rhodofomes roseus]